MYIYIHIHIYIYRLCVPTSALVYIYSHIHFLYVRGFDSRRSAPIYARTCTLPPDKVTEGSQTVNCGWVNGYV